MYDIYLILSAEIVRKNKTEQIAKNTQKKQGLKLKL